MKTRKMLGYIVSTIFMLCVQITLYAQAPQGFTYQAVVRNGSGSPIASQSIGLRVTLENASQVAYYTETHTTTSNAQGVISVVIGAGNQVGLKTFVDIPWENGDVLIKLEIDPAGGASYTAMGEPTPLKSVPYALYAENAKEVVSNPNAAIDDPIFEVKNKLGQVVFGVYEGGVRVYVEDTQIKGAKGGFAVGGLTNQAKAGQAEYFRITPDSARVWVKEVPTVKGAKGGFAVGGLTNQGKTTSANFLNLTPENYFIGQDAGKSITTGLYNSFMGFEAGKSNSIGSNNVFLGYKTGSLIGSGNNNVFIGNRTCEIATLSSQNVAIGNNSAFDLTSSLTSSVIMGDNALTGMKSVIPVSNSLFIGKNAGINLGEGSTSVTNCVFIGTNAGDGVKNTEWSTIESIVALGNSSGKLSNGYRNVFIGNSAGYNYVGHQSTMLGFNVAQNASGTYNVYLGDQSALYAIGDNNTYIGRTSGTWVTGNNNVFLGYSAGAAPFSAPRTESNRLRIGSNNLIYGEFDNGRVVIKGTNTDNPSNYNFYVNGTAGGDFAWNNLSDIKLKKNINTISRALEKVMQLRGVNFEWKDPNSLEKGVRMGFIAQEAEKVIPEVVNKEGEFYSMQYAPVTAILVEAVKEQQKQIESLKAELDAIKALLKK